MVHFSYMIFETVFLSLILSPICTYRHVPLLLQSHKHRTSPLCHLSGLHLFPLSKLSRTCLVTFSCFSPQPPLLSPSCWNYHRHHKCHPLVYAIFERKIIEQLRSRPAVGNISLPMHTHAHAHVKPFHQHTHAHTCTCTCTCKAFLSLYGLVVKSSESGQSFLGSKPSSSDNSCMTFNTLLT